jgi:hypothetical protein
MIINSQGSSKARANTAKGKVMRGVAQFIVALLFWSAVLVPDVASAQSRILYRSYEHEMKFTGSLERGAELIAISKVTFFDNMFICANKGGKQVWQPGKGHISFEGIAHVDLDDMCITKGNCKASVLYPNKQGEVGSGDVTFEDLFGVNGLDVKCQNKNDTLVEFRSKGMCALAYAYDCGDDVDPETVDLAQCTLVSDAKRGFRFNWPVFDPPPAPGTALCRTRDDRCITCVETGSGCPAPDDPLPENCGQ